MPSGGKRKGAGRTLKYGEPITPISVYVPASKKSHIEKIIKLYLKRYERTNNKF